MDIIYRLLGNFGGWCLRLLSFFSRFICCSVFVVFFINLDCIEIFKVFCVVVRFVKKIIVNVYVVYLLICCLLRSLLVGWLFNLFLLFNEYIN